MGKPAARVGDPHICPSAGPVLPLIPHVGGPILPPGCPRVFIGGQPAARVLDLCQCIGPPDIIGVGSTRVFIGGQPAARAFDKTMHGGMITAGFPTVSIG
jgi:uncharacterized Zn-binding protein involved in type VI secretion